MIALAIGGAARADDPAGGTSTPISAVAEQAGSLLDGFEATTLDVAKGHGTWNVTPQGAFTFAVPIEVPPGRGGLQPSVSLVYSSLAGAGIAGQGWSLSGIPAIHRVIGLWGINYDGSDTYAVNYGTWGTAADAKHQLMSQGDGSYRTLEDNFFDYRPSGTCGDGPCSWTVRDGTGNTFIFGDPSMTAPPTPSRNGAASPALWEPNNGATAQRGILLWGLSKVIDRHGNVMTVSYTDPANAGLELLPKRMTYSQHTSQPAGTELTVSFSYESRVDVTPPPYRFDQRLKRIDVFASSSQVRSYQLAYETAPISMRSRLKTVQMLGSDNQTSSPATSFDYQDGRSLYGGGYVMSGILPLIGTSGLAPRIVTGDFNGDGRKDVVGYINVFPQQPGLHVSYGTSEVPTPPQPVTEAPDPVQIPNDGTWQWVVGDVNGDGKDDLVWMLISDSVITTRIAYGSPQGLQQLNPSSLLVPFGNNTVSFGSGVVVVPTDLNGDRKLDVVWAHPNGGGIAYAYGTSNGFSDIMEVAPRPLINVTLASNFAVTGDFNGDNRYDLFMADRFNAKNWFALGDFENPDFILAAPSMPLPLKDDHDRWLLPSVLAVDMNGDHRTDVIVPQSPSEILTLLGHSGRSTASGAGPTYGPLDTMAGVWSGNPPNLMGTAAGDFDGDGTKDVMLTYVDPNNTSVGNSHRVFLGNPTAVFSGINPAIHASNAAVIADVNGDGRDELVWVGDKGLEASSVGRDGVGLQTSIDFATFNFNGAQIAGYTTDFNGDGIDDLVFVNNSQSTDTNSYVVLSNFAKPDLMTAVHTGFGASVTVDYTAAANAYGAIDPTATDCPLPQETKGQCGIPNTLPRQLAIYTQHDNGQGITRTSHYSYSNGRFVPDNMSSDVDLGFANVVRTDDETHHLTGLSFFQDRPRQGQLWTRAENTANKIASTQYDYLVQNNAGGARAIKMRSRVFTDAFFDANKNRTVVHTVSDTFIHNGFGGVVSQTTCDGSAPCITRRNSLTNDPYNWLLNRLDSFVTAVGDGTPDPEQRLESEKMTYAPNGIDPIERDRLLCADGQSCLCPRGGECAPTVARWVAIESQRQYDPFGNVTHVVDANGHATDTSYDPASGLPLTTTRYLISPSGSVAFTTSRTYDFAGRLQTETDLNGLKTTHGYDPLGRTSLLALPTGEVQSYAYVDFGDPNGQHVHFTRTGPGTSLWTDQYFDGDGTVYLTRHNGDGGALISRTRSESWDSSFVHHVVVTPTFIMGDMLPVSYDIASDDTDRVLSIDEVTRGGRTRLRSFDYGAFTTTATDSLGHVVTYTHDDRGLLVQRTDAVGTTQYTYDVRKRLYDVMLPDNTHVTSGFDGWARKVRETDPALGARGSAYDDVGNLVETTDGNGKIVGMTYDSLNRQITRTTAQGTVTMSYDNPADPNGRGRLWRVSEPSGGTELRYDVSGAVASRTRTITGYPSTLTNTWSYDALGRQLSRTYPDGYTLSYGWSEGGHLATVSNNGTTLLGLSDYDGEDHVQTRTLPVATTSLGYNILGELTDLQTLNTSNDDLEDAHYTYDTESNPSTITDRRAVKTSGGVNTDASRTFNYDTVGRLSTATDAATTHTFGYDAIGDLTNNDGVTVTFVPHSFSAAGLSGNYDNAGNLISKTVGTTTWHYAYDDLNRLTTVMQSVKSSPARVVATYDYDWTGTRVRSVRHAGGPTAETFYADGYEVVADTTTPGKMATTKWLDGPGIGAFAIITSGAQIASQPTAAQVEAAAGKPFTGNTLHGTAAGTWYLLPSPLGSTSVVLDSAGKEVTRLAYLAYGHVDQQHATGYDAVTAKFAGRPLDGETGLSYFGARYYDPTVARFITGDDRVDGDPARPIAYNRYAYALDVPTRYTDGSGHDALPMQGLFAPTQILVPMDLCHGAAGYGEFNITGGYILGFTVSQYVGADGTPMMSAGLGLTTPQLSLTMNLSPGSLSEGWSAQASAGLGPASISGGMSYNSFSDMIHNRDGSSFVEGGVSLGASFKGELPASASLMFYYTFPDALAMSRPNALTWLSPETKAALDGQYQFSCFDPATVVKAPTVADYQLQLSKLGPPMTMYWFGPDASFSTGQVMFDYFYMMSYMTGIPFDVWAAPYAAQPSYSSNDSQSTFVAPGDNTGGGVLAPFD